MQKEFVKVSPAADAARKNLVLIRHYSVYANTVNILKQTVVFRNQN